MLALDAALVEVRSEKELARAYFQDAFGYHPLLWFLDEALAGILRTGLTGQHRR